jgi:hypothetical protein
MSTTPPAQPAFRMQPPAARLATTTTGIAAVTSDPTICSFCGQPLLNKRAVEHLARQEATLRKDLEAEAEALAQARVEKVERDLKADAAKQLKAAVQESADKVARLDRQLRDTQKNQEAKVKAEVREQLADAEASQRTRLEQEFGNREKQLQSTLDKLQSQNDELSRRVERLSAGDRGEFNEDAILAQLIRAFPDDDITRTRRGQRGADIFQQVRFRSDGGFIEAGLIIYECKDTLHWNNSFISQMKAQARLHHTPYAILVSRCFPRELKNLAVIDDIVVVDLARAVAIAEVMRRMVMETYRSGVVAGSRVEKTAELFRYVSSTEFRQAFDSLSEATAALQVSLTRERQSHQRVWTERDRHYQSIGEAVVQIDSRFKAILESTGKDEALRSLRPPA